MRLTNGASAHIPHLQQTATSKQLIVDGNPFLVLGAELQNSSMSSAEFMKPLWSKLASDNINTVLGSVSWEQIEPVEGQFDFAEMDKCIVDARVAGLRLIILWFGSFKNGLSTYAPAWVKRDHHRFPRAKLRKAGGRLETSDILSIFGSEAQAADAKAFATLMKHLRALDEKHSTVVMVQVENEVGILGDSRDGSALAEQRFHQPVPDSFVKLLMQNWETLHPTLRSNLVTFRRQSHSSSGLSWPQLFAANQQADELFMAYHYALYVEQVAAAGRCEYPVPLFTNVWQNYGAEDRDTSMPITAGGGDQPGVYPSGGAVINVLDVWQLVATTLDFIAPDVYLNEYTASCAKYRHRNQPLLIPEQRRDHYGARRIWPAFGTYEAVGTSPFGIDTVEVEYGLNPFKTHYALLGQVSQHILAAQRRLGSSFGFYFDELPDQRVMADPQEAQTFMFGDYELKVERAFVFGRPSAASGMIIQLDDLEPKFLLLGWGYQVTFRCARPQTTFTGILSFKEKEVIDAATGEMRTLRLLNGDETRSGQFVIMPSHKPDYAGFPISITIPAGTGIAEVVPYTLDEEE